MEEYGPHLLPHHNLLPHQKRDILAKWGSRLWETPHGRYHLRRNGQLPPLTPDAIRCINIWKAQQGIAA